MPTGVRLGVNIRTTSNFFQKTKNTRKQVNYWIVFLIFYEIMKPPAIIFWEKSTKDLVPLDFESLCIYAK